MPPPEEAVSDVVATLASHAAPVVLEGVRKEYEGGVVAVHGVDLAVDAGEFVVLVGPSGCGKSTTLRMVAGLESITAGGLARTRRRGIHAPHSAPDSLAVISMCAPYPL